MGTTQEAIDVNICLEPDFLAIFAILLVPAILVGLKRNRNAAAWKLMIPLFALLGVSYLFTKLFGGRNSPMVRQFLTIVRIFYIGACGTLAALSETDPKNIQTVKATVFFILYTGFAFLCLTALENVGLFAAVVLAALVVTTILGAMAYSKFRGRLGRGPLFLLMQLPALVAAACMGLVIHLVYAKAGSFTKSGFVPFMIVAGLILNCVTALLLAPLTFFVRRNPSYKSRVASFFVMEPQSEKACVLAA